MPKLRQRLISKFTRFYPFFTGCAPFANSKMLNLVAGESNDEVWTQVKGGEVLASLNDYVGKSAYFVGDLDRKVSWILSQIVKEGDTVFDIGANIGIVTLHLSQLTKSSGMVYAFEPNPYLAALLRETLLKNSLSNVKLFPIALGSQKSKLQLSIPDGNMGAASLVRRSQFINQKIIDVEVDTLANIIEQEKIKNIKLIKIDVEGFEADVLKGGMSFLKEVKPTVILFELNQYDGSFWQQPVVEILRECGYGFFSVPKCLLKMRLVKISHSQSVEPEGHDFLAVACGDSYLQIARLVNAT